MPLTITKQPIKIGNIFACKKKINFGSEANVYRIACCPDVILKIYRYHSYEDTLAIWKIAKRFERIGIGAKILSDIIAFDYWSIFKKNTNFDDEDNKYGFICEKVKTCNINDYEPYSNYEDFIRDKHLLRDTINDLLGFDWWDDSDCNVGVNKSGNLVCIDTGMGFVPGLHISYKDCDYCS